MQRKEAAELLATVASALRDQPPTFTYEITVVGTMVQSSGAGTGLAVTAVGGGPGSSTIGFQSNASTGNVDVVQKAVDDELRRMVEKAADDIAIVAAELERDEPNLSLIDRLIEGLPAAVLGSVVPVVVAAVARSIH